jgi:murein L,D-transpeptidase YcbB/YkuD
MDSNDSGPEGVILPQRGNAEGRDAMPRTAPRLLSRRASVAGGAIGLCAWALAGCAAPDLTMAPPPHSPPSPSPDNDLTRLRDGATPIVAGEELDAPLLRRFYARRGFEPVWPARGRQAAALADTVLRAAEHGLDPELFHANLLRRMGMFPPLRSELLLSHAVLTYAEALAFGAVPMGRRKNAEDLAPAPVDVAAVLDSALDRNDPVAVIESLAPGTPTYQALREALRRDRSGANAGHDQAERRRLIEANLERQRWLPRQLPADRVWVNVPDQRLVLYRDDLPVFATRVVVGEETERKQSPEFQALIEGAFLNPPWIIPADIVEAEILPQLARDPGFLARHNIVLRPNGEAEQAPGPSAGLGAIMFDMPNRFDVYLHDTPDKAAFDRENRRISNGCIRVQKPLEFAALVMDERLDVIHEKVATGDTMRKALPRPVPVFVLYQTAFASPDRELEIRPDFYGRDATLWRRLQKHPQDLGVPAAGQGAGAAVAMRRPAPPRSARGG